MGRRRKAEGEQSAAPEAEGQQGATTAPQQQNGGRSPPATEFRLGRIRATVWANHSESHGTWYSVVVTRSYKDGNDQWKSSGSFGRDDLLVVGEVTRMAFHWISKQQGGGQRQQAEAATTGAAPQGQDQGTTVSDDIPF